MHEFSIAQNIIEIAEDSALQAGCKRVVKIVIEVGTQSGVVYEALETAMESAKLHTMLQHAEVNIIPIKAEARCNQCNNIFPVNDLYTPCPKCNSFDNELVKGKELAVKSIDAE